MRKIVPLMIKLSVLLMALSVIGQQVSATKGDVERALELLKQARAAIGGEAAIGTVQNLSLSGKSRRRMPVAEQSTAEITGDFEMTMMLPDRLIKMEKLMFGTPPPGADKELKLKERKVQIVRGGEDREMHNALQQHERSEMARYMLGLLLTPPPSFNVTYQYAGEGNVDNALCDIVEALGQGGFTLRIYLDKSSHLPLMMSYRGSLPRIAIRKVIKSEGAGANEDEDVVIMRRPEGSQDKQNGPQIVIERKGGETDPSAHKRPFEMRLPMTEDADIQVRFSDFRAVGGVLLPHTLTQLVNGQVETVWTVENYEINSPSINEKFQKVMQLHSKQN